ncbi:MAG: hypothetical protein ACK5DV_09340, partial [Planctomycetota bacterium]
VEEFAQAFVIDGNAEFLAQVAPNLDVDQALCCSCVERAGGAENFSSEELHHACLIGRATETYEVVEKFLDNFQIFSVAQKVRFVNRLAKDLDDLWPTISRRKPAKRRLENVTSSKLEDEDEHGENAYNSHNWPEIDPDACEGIECHGAVLTQACH